jgi:MFS superfamily sulfate permease-like transporter
VLGRIPGTTSWAPLSSAEGSAQVPGVLAVLFATPLWYANATHFCSQLEVARRRAVGAPQAVVLDAIGMSDIDYTGSRALRETLDSFDREHAAFAVARAGMHMRESLTRSGLLQRIGEDHFFDSVDEAVNAVLREGPNAPRE